MSAPGFFVSRSCGTARLQDGDYLGELFGRRRRPTRHNRLGMDGQLLNAQIARSVSSLC